MPPADTLLSLLQLANYLHARGNVVVGVPCFGGRHGRRQRTGRTGPPKHATLGYVTFPFAACYLARVMPIPILITGGLTTYAKQLWAEHFPLDGNINHTAAA